MTSTPKSLSVVMTAHDQASELQRNLPQILSQHYEAGFEVIVVDESSTDETEDVLLQLKAEHKNLYTTYIPASSHYLSRRKLAITIGIKAAKNEWIILTDACCHPDTDNWLATMAEACDDDKDMVCGYTSYTPDTNTYYLYRRMLSFWRQQKHPYCYDGANLAIRKSAFMARNGFLKNLQYLRGEYDFLVNETERSRIAVMRNPEGYVRQEAPTKKSWNDSRLYYIDIRSHLRHTFVPRIRFFLSHLALHVGYWLLVIALAWAVLLKHDIVYVSLIAALLLFYIVLRIFIPYRIVNAFNEHISWWKPPFYDLRIAWTNLWLWMKYKASDKNDFTRK